MRTLFLLQPPAAKPTIQDTIYSETARYLRQNIAGACECKVESDAALIEFVKREDVSVVVVERTLPLQTMFVLKGLGLVLILIGSDRELSELADIAIDPAAPPAAIGFTGPPYLLGKILEMVSLDELAARYQLSATQVREDVDSNLAESRLLDVVSLFKRRDWDSSYFGFNVGFVSCFRLTPTIERRAREYIRREKMDLFEYLCNCHDKLSVTTAERSGYSFVDIRLTFERRLSELTPSPPKAGWELRLATPADLPRLKELGTDIYRDSRYYFDGNFERAKVVQFYLDWIEKAVLGTFDDYTFVLCQDGQPIGFCSIKEHKKRSARVGVFGLDAAVRGSGAGKYLLDGVLAELKKRGREHVEVVTQGRNYAAQRLYQRSGFITQKTELWYHKWLN